jgi:formylmethanofuran--tetrahydromethanopterin N-formyltransferase
MSAERLGQAVANRTGQCLMTCPTTSVYDGLEGEGQRIPLGRPIRFFGDGFQKSKLVAGTRYWRIPVMDGEFLVVESLGAARGVAGGNILVEATSGTACLAAVRRATTAASEVPGVIMPFPGGVARSGSKVGSRYRKLKASTSDRYCPTLRGRVETELHPEAHCAYEIVIDGVDEAAVRQAMRVAIEAAVGPEVPAVTAGNYGGRLGKYHLRLHDILRDDAAT